MVPPHPSALEEHLSRNDLSFHDRIFALSSAVKIAALGALPALQHSFRLATNADVHLNRFADCHCDQVKNHQGEECS
jgi:hypothetical protein